MAGSSSGDRNMFLRMCLPEANAHRLLTRVSSDDPWMLPAEKGELTAEATPTCELSKRGQRPARRTSHIQIKEDNIQGPLHEKDGVIVANWRAGRANRPCRHLDLRAKPAPPPTVGKRGDVQTHTIFLDVEKYRFTKPPTTNFSSLVRGPARAARTKDRL